MNQEKLTSRITHVKSELSLDQIEGMETMFRALMEEANDGIVVVTNGVVVFANPKFAQMLDYEVADIQGEPFQKMLGPTCLNQVMERYEARKRGDPVPPIVEMEIVARNGNLVPVEVRSETCDRHGVMTNVGIIRDITHRKAAEKALQDSEAQLKITLDSIHTGVLIIDSETHTVIDANRHALEMIGAEKDQVIGRECYGCICPAKRGSCPITDLEQVVDASEQTLTTIGGETIPVLKSIVRTEIGGRNVLIESLTDITERRQAQDKIQAQYEEIQIYSYEIEATNNELQEAQKQLIEVNRDLRASQDELSTPVVEVWDKILVLPVIGLLDSHRSQSIMEVLLSRIVETQAEMVILDITGVSMVDTHVANHLIKTVQAANMLGTECVITGIKPEIAQTMIHLGLDMESFPTRRNLREGLLYGLKKVGYEVQKSVR